MAAGILAASCQKMPLTAPSGTAITLVASTNVLPVNGSADITAVLIQGSESGGGTTTGGGTSTGSITAGGGEPVHNGTVVNFTTSLGRIEPAQATTDAGSATVQLIADGQSGTATITAFSGSATKTLTVSIGAAGAALITVTATPQSLPATGGHATIDARVADQQGNGLLGIPVSFSTTAGTLTPATAVTDKTGVATTDLDTTAAATVTATAGGASAALTGSVAVSLEARTTLTITAPTTLMVGVPATFTVTPGGNTIVTDATLDFGDGSSTDLKAISGATTATHIYLASNEYNVVAAVTDSTGQTVQSGTNVAVGPLTAVGTASPQTTTVGSPVAFTVTPAANAIIARYDWDFGDGSQPTSTSSGQTLHGYSQRGNYVVTVNVVPYQDGQVTQVLIPVTVD